MRKFFNMSTPSIWLLCMFILYLGQGYYVATNIRNKIRTVLNNYRRILLPTRISNWAWSIQNQQTGRGLDHHVAIPVLLPMQRKLLPLGFSRGLKTTRIHFGRRMGLYFNNIRQFTFKAFTYILRHLREKSQLTGNFSSNSGWKGNFWILLDYMPNIPYISAVAVIMLFGEYNKGGGKLVSHDFLS